MSAITTEEGMIGIGAGGGDATSPSLLEMTLNSLSLRQIADIADMHGMTLTDVAAML